MSNKKHKHSEHSATCPGFDIGWDAGFQAGWEAGREELKFQQGWEQGREALLAELGIKTEDQPKEAETAETIQ